MCPMYRVAHAMDVHMPPITSTQPRGKLPLEQKTKRVNVQYNG